MTIVKLIERALFKQQKRKLGTEYRSPVLQPAIVSKRKPVRNRQKKKKKKMSVLAQQGVQKTDDQIYTELSKDFPEELILYRADGMRTIETIHVINRLNKGLGVLNWSWKCSTPVLKNDEYSCAGRLDIYVNGRNAYRQQIGSCRLEMGNGAMLTHGEAQTGSIQQALKKAASLIGVGANQVYSSKK